MICASASVIRQPRAEGLSCHLARFLTTAETASVTVSASRVNQILLFLQDSLSMLPGLAVWASPGNLLFVPILSTPSPHTKDTRNSGAMLSNLCFRRIPADSDVHSSLRPTYCPRQCMYGHCPHLPLCFLRSSPNNVQLPF